MSQLLTLGANDKTLKFCFFVIRVYGEKLSHILEPLVAKYRPDLFARLRDIAERQVPANLKPIVGAQNSFFWDAKQIYPHRFVVWHSVTSSHPEFILLAYHH